MYEFWVIMLPRALGALVLIALTVWGLRYARFADMRRRYRAQKARLAELERYQADATKFLAALTVYRSLDNAPQHFDQWLTNLLAGTPTNTH